MGIRVWSVCVLGVMAWGAFHGAAQGMTQGRIVQGVEAGVELGRPVAEWGHGPWSLSVLLDDAMGRESVGRPWAVRERVSRSAPQEATQAAGTEKAGSGKAGGEKGKGDKSSGEQADGDKAGKEPAARVQSGVSPVNLNSSSAEQIEALPGIGPALAARIVEYRQQHGPFKRVEDLMNVRGVGEKNFLKLKPLITVSVPKAEQ